MTTKCSKASAIDLAAFVVDPHDPDFPDFAAFRQHYPECTVCTAEVAKWTKLAQLLQESSEPPAAPHPRAELLVQFRHHRSGLPESDRQALEQHLQTCSGCREEFSLLDAFDFRRIQQWEREARRETTRHPKTLPLDARLRGHDVAGPDYRHSRESGNLGLQAGRGLGVGSKQEEQHGRIERSRAFFARLFDALQFPGWQPVFAATATLLLGIGIARFFSPPADNSLPPLDQILQEPDRGIRTEQEQTIDDGAEAKRLTQQMLQLEQQGKYTEAIPLAQQAVILYEKLLGSEHPDTATALDNLASLYREMGDYARALPLAQRASSIRQKVLGTEHPDTSDSLNNLALIYRAMENYAQALPLFQRALAIAEKTLGPQHSRTAIPLGNLASLYQDMGDYTQALPLFQRALAIREKVLGPDHPRTAITLSNLASLYQDMGDYTQALPLFQRALAIREKVLGPDHPRTATSLSSLASLYRDMQDYTHALPLAQRAVAIHEQVLGPEHPHTATSLYTVATLYRDMGDYKKALQFAERCVYAQDQVFRNVFAVTSETQKLLFVEKSQEPSFMALSLIATHFPTDPAAVRLGLEIVLRRKGIVLDAQAKTQQTLAAELHGDAWQSWQRLIEARSTLAHLLLRGPGQQTVPEYKRAINTLQGTIAHEETFLAQQSSVAAQQLTQQKVTAQRVAARLPRDGVLVEFVYIQNFDEQQKKWSNTWRYLSFVLTPDNQVHVVDLGDAQELDAQIEQTLTAINASNQELATHFTAVTNKTDTALTALSQTVLRPLVPYLGTHTQLIVSPDGELNRVPFAALRASDDRYLIEHVTLAYIASGRDLLQEQSRAATTVDLLLVADPAFDSRTGLGGTSLAAAVERAGDFDNGFDPLPGTAQEAEAIPALLNSTQKPLLQAQATESAVRAVRAPKILHLATHGFFLKNKEIFFPDALPISDSSPSAPLEINPMVRSGLALAGANHAKEITTGDDGLLTALEVTSMDLHGTDLVVLSACETGLGNVQVGEGVYGLRRAFTLAGAKNLVMSLWKANDLMTLYQMKAFYRAYRDGASAAAALRQAQLQSIANLRAQTRTSYGTELAPVKLWATFLVQQTAAEDAKP